MDWLNDKKTLMVQWLLPLFIFLVALAVRIPAIGVFLTIDEPLWINRSVEFLKALVIDNYECPPLPLNNGRMLPAIEWGCTFQGAHPGVTTMWGGSIGLLGHYGYNNNGDDLATFLQNLNLSPVDKDLIAPMRLPLAIITALFFPLFYLLTMRLLSPSIALVASLLLALNPFHIAMSRVLHHDALNTTFMTLSLLMMVGYWLQNWRWPWLIISGVCAGLACLSKTIGLFMFPFAALVGVSSLYYTWLQGSFKPKQFGRIIIEGGLWGIIVFLTFFAGFPAMWQIPLQTLSTMYSVATRYAQLGHVMGHYFFGEILPDPGLFFYPVVWGLRASPVEFIALILSPVLGAITVNQWRSYFLIKYKSEIVLFLFVALLLLLETISSKKMLRYFLPAFPIIAIFIAYTLVGLSNRVIPRFIKANIALPLTVGGVLLIQGWLVWQNYPYYSTYYNPLLGGAPVASQAITIFGWGEGHNEAAEFLNSQPNSEQIRVVGRNGQRQDTLSTFFVGEVFSSNDLSEIMEADYILHFQNELQRNLQSRYSWNYLNNHQQPVHRVTLQGLDHVIIYRNPIENRIKAKENSLPNTYVMGYNLQPNGHLTLFWQNQGFDDSIWIGLEHSVSGAIEWTNCELIPTFVQDAQQPGSVLESLCIMNQAKKPTGLYSFKLGMGEATNIISVPFPTGRLAVMIDETGQFRSIDYKTAQQNLVQQQQSLAGVLPLDVPLGHMLKIIGYQLEPREIGQPNTLTLHLQTLQDIDISQFIRVLKLNIRYISKDKTTSDIIEEIPVALATNNSTQNQYLSWGEILTLTFHLTMPEATFATEQIKICMVDIRQQTTINCFTDSMKN